MCSKGRTASALSQGHAGHVQGGNRLPWLQLPDGDNFAPLRQLNWQLHVYGEATPALHEAATTAGLSLETFAWNQAADAAGFERDALYLVRPDGYIALASPGQDVKKLQAFLNQFALHLRL